MSEDNKITLLSEVRREKEKAKIAESKKTAEEMVESAEMEPDARDRIVERIKSEQKKTEETSSLLSKTIVEVLDAINENEPENNTFVEIADSISKLFNRVEDNNGRLVPQTITIHESISFDPTEVGDFDGNVNPSKLARNVLALQRNEMLCSKLELVISDWFNDKASEIIDSDDELRYELDFHTNLTQISVDPNNGKISIFYTLEVRLLPNVLIDMED